MKPGERIRFITECAESLLTRSWAEAQLTLDQFGFETYEPRRDWDEFDDHAYFIGQVKDGSNENIRSLHEYLLGDDAAPTSSANQPWGSLPLKVFLSHIHKHRAFVGETKRRMATNGIDAFVAHDDIQPSKQWREVIKTALQTCDAMAVFLHDGFHDSQWCDQEVGWAMGRGIPIIVVRPLESIRRDGFLEEHQDMPMQDESLIATRVLKVLATDPRTRTAATEAVAEAFVNSYSYDRTRELCELLDQQAKIEEPQLQRLEYAVQTNRQVYECVRPSPQGSQSVPDFISALQKRHRPPSPWDDAEEPF